ncbi:MAG TPA: hypothetical protein VNA66_07560 [Gammaproteobacteria bacterium]|nr:hypothetical protein [Gammaproteobacteria bacterium]
MSASVAHSPAANVALADLDRREVVELLAGYGARLVELAAHETIPGSYWGESEAGLIGDAVYARADTPAHSLLHELCHYICMDDERRAALATDAGGNDDEESAVCYLQVLLAQNLRGFSTEQCLRDMDSWGYSFREGSARAWFESDGRYARAWLLAHGLIDVKQKAINKLRRASRV